MLDADSLVSTAEAARICRVDPITVRGWVVKLGLPIAAQDGEGRSLYRIADVIDCVRLLKRNRPPRQLVHA